MLQFFGGKFSDCQVFINYTFFVNKISCTQHRFRCASVHVKEQTSTLLIITWYDGRNYTKSVLKPLAAKNEPSISVLCIILYCRLYYFSLHDDYQPFLYTMRPIYIAALLFLINWNEKRHRESNILTMDHELVLENSSSNAVNTLLNTIIYLKAIKYLDIRLRQKAWLCKWKW